LRQGPGSSPELRNCTNFSNAERCPHGTSRPYRRRAISASRDPARQSPPDDLLRSCRLRALPRSARGALPQGFGGGVGLCLMLNHVHLVVTPSAPDGLARALGETHRRSNGFINARARWSRWRPHATRRSIRCARGWSHALRTGRGRAHVPIWLGAMTGSSGLAAPGWNVLVLMPVLGPGRRS
jgi:hypothetical protein